jgi:signal transduction histidine kinase
MLSPTLVLTASAAYLLLLFGVAAWGDRRAAAGRSVIANPWAYALSMAVYCTAWTYFGSVGRAATTGVWFLPIYLGPTLAMVLAVMVLRKMIRIARRGRITSIADFIASRHGHSPLLAGLVTLITVVGIVPYIALQLKAIDTGYALLTGSPGAAVWWRDGTFWAALQLAGFTMIFGTRQLDSGERHEGMVAAIAFESIVKLVAFLAVGIFVTWGLYGGPAALFARVAEQPELRRLLTLGGGSGPGGFAWTQWFALTLLAGLSVIFLPRQFQVMVVENVDERHLKRAAWVFPAYLWLINLFVLPIAFGGLLHFGSAEGADAFVLSLPLAHDARALALLVFVGGLSAATGMIVVEAIAVSTMVCNDLVMPILLRTQRFRSRHGGELRPLLLTVRRAAILVVLMLGYLYFHLAGEAYALVSIGLISFAAVAQFAPAALGGMYWKGGTQRGALIGLAAGFGLWAYTLMLPSIARSGWLPDGFVQHGPWGIALLKPESLLGLAGLDNLTHALFWSLLANVGAYVGVSLWRAPSPREASQAALFVDVGDASQAGPAFWRGQTSVAELLPLASRYLGAERAQRLFAQWAQEQGLGRIKDIRADARFVQFVETQLAGAIGSASARALMASSVHEEPLGMDDVMRILDEATQLRAYSRLLEDQRASLERASAELRAANQRLESLDRMKDDFMSSVTHELRTPLTSIRALAELMADDPDMDSAQRQQFLGIVVAETERLSRLVNQVLDLAKIESGHAEWHPGEVDMAALIRQAAQSMAELLREQGTALVLDLAEPVPTLHADADRLTQVLLNLLGNAAKFAPHPGGEIRVVLRHDADGLTVRVQDNGPGVPPTDRAHVFDRFHQAGDASNRVAGTGLGLPISRQIIEHHGGSIQLENDAAQGATFAIRLPWHGPGKASTEQGDTP